MGNFRLGICEWAFPLPGPGGLKLAAEVGLQGMELDFGEYEKGFPLSNERIQKRYLEEGAKYGIDFPSMATNAMALHGLSKPLESAQGIVAVECLKKAIAAADAMKIPVLQIPGFDNSAIASESDFRNTCEKLRIATRLAEPLGIIIAVENILGADDVECMIADVDSPNLKIFYDTQNYFINKGMNQADLLRRIHKHVVQIHIKDGYNGKISSALLGQGNCRFMDTAQVIVETRCVEWLHLENYYNVRPLSDLDSDPFALLAEDVAIAKKIFSIQ